MNAKSSLREAARKRRAELARAHPDFGQRIAGYSDALPLKDIRVVAGYWPVRDEADVRPLMSVLAAAGLVLALPRIEGRDLSFHGWKEGDAVETNTYGIGEPVASGAPLKPGLILVPLLAFDRAGHRLGYGGGFYDRLLARHAAIAVGIAYAGQEVQELSPEPHDRALDMVLTEHGLRSFGT